MHKGENPVIATVVVPQLITEEEEAAQAAAAVAAADVPTTEQAAAPKEGEELPRADKGAAAKGGDKAAPKAGEKPAAATRARKKTRSDPPDRRPRQSRAGVRAHAPQRRLLAGGALRAGATASSLRKDPKLKALVGTWQATPSAGPGSAAADLHEPVAAAGAELARFFKIKPEEDPGRP